MSQFQLIDQSPGPDPKRLLLAVIAMSAMLLVYSYFFAKTPPAPIPNGEAKPAENIKDVAPKIFKAEVRHPHATPSDIPELNRDFVVNDETDGLMRTSYVAQISSKGGMISRFVLTDFSREKILFDRNEQSILLALSSKEPADALNADSKYELIASDEKSIELSHITPSGLGIRRRYEFLPRALVKESIVIKNLSDNPKRIELSLLLSKHNEPVKSNMGFLSAPQPVNNVSLKSEAKFEKYVFKDLNEEKIWSSVNYVAFDDQYFLSAFIPKKEDIKLVRAKAQVENGEHAKLEIDLSPQVLLAGEEKSYDYQIFLGPKQIDLLRNMQPSLEENVDFGWFSALCRPMLWLLVKIYEVVGNFGLAIILITLLIKLLTHPLTRKSFSSQAEMKKIAPKIQELSKKYGHDRSLLGQKQIELYREHGINPMAGCLPLLIQLPIWFAFYRMLGFSVELYDQPFVGFIHDLTLPDPYYVLPLAMGASMLITQSLMPPQLDQPQMKYVLWMMPIFFTFIMLNMPAGLSLYILTNNLLTIVQQIIIKKRA